MAVGLFGKVPARGDFVTSDIAPDVVARWEATMAAMTVGSEQHLGAAWEDLWDRAPAWGFWIGSGVPSGPAAGLLRPSRDRVGRRYPVLLLADGTDGLPAPPVIPNVASQEWYTALMRVSEALMEGQGAPAEIVAELPDPPRLIGPPQDRRSAFFAESKDGLQALLQDTGPHDHGLTAARRSYWWAEGNGGAAMLMALDGLPEPSLAAHLLQVCSNTSASGPTASEASPSAAPLDEPEVQDTPVREEDAAPASDEHSPFGAASAAERPRADLKDGGDESPFGPNEAPQKGNSLVDRLRGRH